MDMLEELKEIDVFLKERTFYKDTYTTNQLLDYDEYVAIEHIIEWYGQTFSSNIDIYKLFNEIKENLRTKYKVIDSRVLDRYKIPYPNIGENCHTLIVVTEPNSNKILTMYPFQFYELDVDEEELHLAGNVRRLKRKSGVRKKD